MRLTIIRLQPNRFFKTRRRFRVTLGSKIHRTEVVVRLRRLWVSAPASACTSRSPDRIADLCTRRAETVVCVDVILFESHRLLKFIQRPPLNWLRIERGPEIVMRFRENRASSVSLERSSSQLPDTVPTCCSRAEIVLRLT